jgi:hypothetical protein
MSSNGLELPPTSQVTKLMEKEAKQRDVRAAGRQAARSVEEVRAACNRTKNSKEGL